MLDGRSDHEVIFFKQVAPTPLVASLRIQQSKPIGRRYHRAVRSRRSPRHHDDVEHMQIIAMLLFQIWLTMSWNALPLLRYPPTRSTTASMHCRMPSPMVTQGWSVSSNMRILPKDFDCLGRGRSKVKSNSNSRSSALRANGPTTESGRRRRPLRNRA